MKDQKFNARQLTRTELAKIKGGIDCNTVYTQCAAKCGQFSSDYPRFATCVTGLTTMCSPLHGWYVDCPND